ncbi:hypothetical protein HRE53_22835 [Acaryochloris sp. 'Moss Beach']|uniref:hypothetical protein n=1 Tax=Acaryochloris sp. 'Moss Beach' TaxID=2740837 RepID=UPI001F469A8F|nr:hypothetical protein [Acaryochloris sp. 'Moss Beach']UJB69191.1 hypothetical protein HRE53_22835 [Acaryochloris sp. 'Moss Beach']
MNIDGLSYRQWQKRNTDTFKNLSKQNQKAIRDKGYYNVGWERVQKSWEILQVIILPSQPTTIFEVKLKRGDLVGAIDQSLLSAKQATQAAQEGRTRLRRKSQKIKDLAETTLNKYQLL